MKNFNTVLSIVLLAAVGVLFFLVLKDKELPSRPKASAASGTSVGGSSAARIAYFEWDTLEQNYEYLKDIRAQLKERQQVISNELEGMKRNYMNRSQVLVSKEKSMSQEEGQAAQEEIQQMESEIQQKGAQYSEDLQKLNFNLKLDVNKRIEAFLKTYNEEKKYAYILSHMPGDFIFYKDSTNDITEELVRGLNAEYKKKP